MPYVPDRYLFAAWDNDDQFALWISVLVLVATAILYFTSYRQHRKLAPRLQKRRKWYVGPLIATGFGIFICCLEISRYLHHQRIKQHFAVTNGILTAKKWHSGKNSHWEYGYRYQVNGHNYFGTEVFDMDTGGKEVQTDSSYLLVYNELDPKEAVLDLHMPGSWFDQIK